MLHRIFFILISIMILCSLCASAHEIQVGGGIGIVSPSVNIRNAGDDLFGKGAGDEWEGLVGLTKVNHSLWFWGNARITMTKYFVLDAEFGYWKKTEATIPLLLPSVKVNNVFRDVSIGSQAILIKQRKVISPYIGGGVRFHFLKAEINPEGYPEIAEKGNKFTVSPCISGGVDIKVSKVMSLVAAADYDFLSNWKQAKFYTGVRFRIMK